MGGPPVFGALVILAILCAIGLGFFHWINLIDETHLAALPREGPLDAAAVTHLTKEDFRNHSALGVLVLDRKCVLVSKDPIFDALLLLDPRSVYSPANRDHGEVRFASDTRGRDAPDSRGLCRM